MERISGIVDEGTANTSDVLPGCELREPGPLQRESLKSQKWNAEWDLSSIPRKVFTTYNSQYCGSLSGGRPKLKRTCERCGLLFGGREIRTHERECKRNYKADDKEKKGKGLGDNP